MKPGECPVHRAAAESRKGLATQPLLTRVGPSSATPECATCAFCQKALEVVRLNGTDSPKIADAWMELWHNDFDL